MVHGGNLLLEAEDAGGTVELLLEGDPDGAVKLYYNGVSTQSFRTQRDGIDVVDSNGNAPEIDFLTYDETLLGRITVPLAAYMSVQHFPNGEDIWLSAVDSGATGQWVGIDVSVPALRPNPVGMDLGVAETGTWGDIHHTGSINPSDRRKKVTISGSDLGLDFVNNLEPVSYMFKDIDLSEFTYPDGTSCSGILTHHRRHYGLISQDVEATLSGIGKDTEDFAGFIRNEDDGNDFYGLRYTEFMAPMIKAIQELSDKIDDLTTRIEALEV